MGGFLSTVTDDAKQISGILAADYSTDHPNYLAIVNVNKFDHDVWDEMMVKPKDNAIK